MSKLKDVSEDTFEAVVLESERKVLVDFWAPWCGPCRQIQPALEAISEENSDVEIVKLNIDDNQNLASRYSVMSIPTMILFESGDESKRISGALPKRQLEKFLEV